MKLSTHIANRFLTDETLPAEMLETHMNRIKEQAIKNHQPLPEPGNYASTAWLLNPKESKNYILADTVTSKLELIKIDPPFRYTIFHTLPNGKRTYICPNNIVVRTVKRDDRLHVAMLHYSTTEKYLNWHIWYASTASGVSSIDPSQMHAVYGDGKQFTGVFDTNTIGMAERLAYYTLCFMHFTEVSEEILKAGARVGTKKSGKIVNDIPKDLILVNSKWNITAIRTEGFQVKGHIALRWSGPGKTLPKFVFIEPFEKKGYIRKAGKLVQE